MRSKLRKGSLSKADESSLSMYMGNSSMASARFDASSSFNESQKGEPLASSQRSANGNSSAAVFSSVSSSSSSRKSLISNPSNFLHVQHMGPQDGKMLLQVDPAQSQVTHTTHKISPATLQNLPSLAIFEKKYFFYRPISYIFLNKWLFIFI